MTLFSSDEVAILPPDSRRFSIRRWLPFLLIILLAIATRFAGLGRLDISTDEGHSYITATSPNGVMAELQHDIHPPLYFFMLKGWIALFGSSLVAMRSLSALAGIAVVGMIGVLAWQCKAARAVVLWSMLLAALTPMQIHYSQDARSYSLSCFLMIGGLSTFLWGIESRRLWAWTVYAIVVALSFYSHSLLMPMVAGYWIAALVMRFAYKEMLCLFAAHVGALILAVPALVMMLHQDSASALAWTTELEASRPLFLLFLHSYEVMGLGAGMITAISATYALPIRLLAAISTFFLIDAVFYQVGWNVRRAKKSRTIFVDFLPLLLVFAIWPLLFLLFYSFFVHPIYFVGRYDIFAQPAFLIILGAGFAKLQSRKKIPKAGFQFRIITLLAAAILMFSATDYFLYHPTDIETRHERRSDYLSQHLLPSDRILCTGDEASATLYYLQQRHLKNPLTTFPEDTLSHIGWVISYKEIQRRSQEWPSLATKALEMTATPRSAKLWIVLDEFSWNQPPAGSPQSPRQWLTDCLLEVARQQGWQRAAPDANSVAEEDRLRIISLVRKNTDSP